MSFIIILHRCSCKRKPPCVVGHGGQNDIQWSCPWPVSYESLYNALKNNNEARFQFILTISLLISIITVQNHGNGDSQHCIRKWLFRSLSPWPMPLSLRLFTEEAISKEDSIFLTPSGNNSNSTESRDGHGQGGGWAWMVLLLVVVCHVSRLAFVLWVSIVRAWIYYYF